MNAKDTKRMRCITFSFQITSLRKYVQMSSSHSGVANVHKTINMIKWNIKVLLATLYAAKTEIARINLDVNKIIRICIYTP